MPDNPTGWLDVLQSGIRAAGSIFGGGSGPPAGLPASILPRDPDQSIDWETIVGLPQTDLPAGVPGGAVPGCQVTLPAVSTTRFKAPRGYVIVYPDDPSGRTGTPVAMLKSVAKSCKLWREPAKPPIKASDWRCLRKSASVIRKVDRVAQTANQITGKASLTRSRPKKR